jgi:hypothetical protein
MGNLDRAPVANELALLGQTRQTRNQAFIRVSEIAACFSSGGNNDALQK